jgi:hypothetical protein
MELKIFLPLTPGNLAHFAPVHYVWEQIKSNQQAK